MQQLHAAGLDSLPGGGAEIFAPEIRMEIAGDKHATDILDSNPELAEMIAIWFKYHL